MDKKVVKSWKFIGDNGDFEIESPHRTSNLYFPLINDTGITSVVTPQLHGDIKTGQHTFLMQPVSVEDLHNTRSARSFWVHNPDKGIWSATGTSAKQLIQKFDNVEDDEVVVKAGFLWHQVRRRNARIGLESLTTNFIPASEDKVELMNIQLTNFSDVIIQFTPTAAIPIFGRSADNLRDHRHVSSLLHRTSCSKNGVLVCPTLSFDERGHQMNRVIYAVLGVDSDGHPPIGFFPNVDDFIGEGGTFDWPEAIVKNSKNYSIIDQSFEGRESLGGLRFQDTVLKPGQSCSFLLIIGVIPLEKNVDELLKRYGSQKEYENWLNKTKDYWHQKIELLSFQTGNKKHDNWLKWVGFQPILRRQIGNSFLPYHDYGKGGRGWRDLWQDILSSLVVDKDKVVSFLFDNFAGVRLDGSNATIVGNQPGEFKADRNNIARVWMDHGAWPFLTTRLYIDQTGDLSFLLKEQSYFKDHLACRAQAVDALWDPSMGTAQLDEKERIYKGTILEHLLVQHLTAFFNVGEHNHIKLEDADWNDGMDMAAERGESVAFTALYAGNLRQLSRLLFDLQKNGVDQIYLAKEIFPLLDTLGEKIDFGNFHQKMNVLGAYFSSVRHKISGKKLTVGVSDLAKDLTSKADFLSSNIRSHEWITNKEGFGWFNGYYDNEGHRLEGDFPNGIRMTLTGQVFTLMGGVATEEQAQKIIQSADRYLYDGNVGGYKLNTNFNQLLMNMGRCFGFSYGDKENGAVFSHMAVMYAYALYDRGYVHEGYKVMDSLYKQSIDFPISRIYPGIPEYFNTRGRGLYPYLTGSASWYLFTLLTQVFGVKGNLGNLLLSPRLVRKQFNSRGNASVSFWFADRHFKLTYKNKALLTYGNYRIENVWMDEHHLSEDYLENIVEIPRERILALHSEGSHRIIVQLSEK